MTKPRESNHRDETNSRSICRRQQKLKKAENWLISGAVGLSDIDEKEPEF